MKEFFLIKNISIFVKIKIMRKRFKNLKNLLNEYISWKWVGIILLPFTIIFILDRNIMETTIIIFYSFVFVVLLVGFLKFLYLKKTT
jgi:hypothetical protein